MNTTTITQAHITISSDTDELVAPLLGGPQGNSVGSLAIMTEVWPSVEVVTRRLSVV